MTRVLILCFLLASFHAQSQSYNDFDDATASLRIGAGYTHDFPGLNGYNLAAEYSRSIAPWLQGAFGAKFMQMQGHPRTPSIGEFTKASTIDFTIYAVPVNTYQSQLRLGLGYSFVFYQIQRSYPTYEGADKTPFWNAQAGKGRCSGVNLSADYEISIPESPFSVGLRAAWYKSYDRVTSVGPYMVLAL